MNIAPPPTVLQWLKVEPNPAADAALVESLPQLNGALQSKILDLLAARGRSPALCALVERFASFDRELQAIILTRASSLSTVLGDCLQSPNPSVQRAAVAIIVAGGNTQFANLLADRLKSKDAGVREIAARGICRLVGKTLDNSRIAVKEPWFDPPSHAMMHVGEALARSVALWEFHRLSSVVEAALFLPAWTLPAIRKKLRQSDSDLKRWILDILAQDDHGRHAEAAVMMLAVPELRCDVATLIRTSNDRLYVRKLLDQTWLLDDSAISSGLRRIGSLRWLSDESDLIFEMDLAQCHRAVRWLGGLAGPDQASIERFRALVRQAHPPMMDAAAWHLCYHPSTDGLALLCELRSRLGGSARRLVEFEIRRRGVSTAEMSLPVTGTTETATDTLTKTLAEYWNRFDRVDATAQTLRETLLSQALRLPPLLRQRLAFGIPALRCRTLRMIRELGITGDLLESIYRLTADVDATVRGTAVSLLADVSNLTATRLVRQAVVDVDPRVQANALAVLDDWKDPERTALATTKLGATHNRVRAIAIKTLLPLDVAAAGEALLEMLNHTSRRFRMSALWVVEELKLRTLAPRIAVLGHGDPDLRVRRKAALINQRLASMR